MAKGRGLIDFRKSLCLDIYVRFLSGLLSLILVGATHASVTVFSSLDPASTSSHGYFNGLTKISDIVQISSTMGEIEQVRISLAGVSGGSGAYKMHFHQLNAGADGLLHTLDDTLGNLIGSWASQNATPTSNSLLTLTGTPVTVPQTFVWILEKETTSPSFQVYVTPLENFTYGYSNARTAFKNDAPFPALAIGGPVSVDASAPYNFNYQIEMISVPEPGSSVLVILFAAGELLRRRLPRKT